MHSPAIAVSPIPTLQYLLSTLIQPTTPISHFYRHSQASQSALLHIMRLGYFVESGQEKSHPNCLIFTALRNIVYHETRCMGLYYDKPL